MKQEYWHHFAHLRDINVRVGDWVKKGDKLGTVGNSGASTACHLHWEIQRQLRDPRTKYTTGMSREQVEQVYWNPAEYLKSSGALLPLAGGVVSGYTWLSKVSNTKLHPGWDLNVGTGNNDCGLPIIAPEDGVIDYAETSAGWGKHLFLKINDIKMQEEIEKLKKDVAKNTEEINDLKQKKAKLKPVYKQTKEYKKGKLFYPYGGGYKQLKVAKIQPFRKWLGYQDAIEDKAIEKKEIK